MFTEEPEPVHDFRWTRASDNSLCIHTDGRVRLVSPSYCFNKQILLACQQEKPQLALGLADQDSSMSLLLGNSILNRVNGVWTLNHTPLKPIEERLLKSTFSSSVSASVATAAIVQARQGDALSRDSLMIDSPLQSVDACLIASIGWPEYLRRNGSITIDSDHDLTGRRTLRTLAESQTTGKRVFICNQAGSTLFAVEVHASVSTCDEAVKDLARRHPALHATYVRNESLEIPTKFTTPNRKIRF